MSRTLTTIALALSLMVLAGCAVFRSQAPRPTPLPPDLIGIWVSEGAVLCEGALYEGFAIYAFPDGRGAMVAGPPPIGLEVVLSYDAETGLLQYTYEEIESDGTVESGSGEFYFDRGRNILRAGGAEGSVLRRERPEISQELEEALGLEEKSFLERTRHRLGLE